MKKPSERIQELANEIQKEREKYEHYWLHTPENREKHQKESYIKGIVKYLDEECERNNKCDFCERFEKCALHEGNK